MIIVQNTRNPSFITRHLSLVTRHSSFVTRHLSLVTRHSSLILFLFLFLSSGNAFSQFSAGADDTINPGVPVTLNASYGLIGTDISTTDDGVEGPYPIGFSFSFFGLQYTQFYVGANGWISFSPNVSARGRRDAFAVPSAADYAPKNCILGPFQDLNPEMAGGPYIFYQTIGDTPNRKLVVMWCQCPMYHCITLNLTFQIILNEGQNTIENHIFKKPDCVDWLNNSATLGLQNTSGYIGFAVPGHNATSWTADSLAWKYSPTSVDSFQVASIPYHLEPMTPGNKISYSWYEGSSLLSDQQSIVVTPMETTTYRAYCTVCSGQVFTDEVTVYVIPYIPNAFTPDGDGLNDKFRIVGLPPENITQFNLQIYNRWGQMVFSTNDILEAWDGSNKGAVCTEGIYTWVIYYENNKKTKVSNKGSLMLLR